MSGNTEILRCHGSFLLSVASLAALFVLPGCGDFRRAVGMDRVGPDEFAVESRAPLTIPPDFNLRPPQPGARRAQDTAAAERARRAIDAAGPGEPGKQAAAGPNIPQAMLTRGQQPDPTQQVADQSLAAKLLNYKGGNSGVTLDKRETTVVKGVY